MKLGLKIALAGDGKVYEVDMMFRPELKDAEDLIEQVRRIGSTIEIDSDEDHTIDSIRWDMKAIAALAFFSVYELVGVGDQLPALRKSVDPRESLDFELKIKSVEFIVHNSANIKK